MTTHKIDVLKQIAKILNSMNIIWNVGASCMLYLNGVVDTFHDIDIMVQEKDALNVKHALEHIGKIQSSRSTNTYQTTHFYEFVIDSVDVDIMAGYKVISDGKLFEFPLTENEVDRHVIIDHIAIPLASLTDWLAYYKAMHRTDKVMLIEAYLKKSLGRLL